MSENYNLNEKLNTENEQAVNETCQNSQQENLSLENLRYNEYQEYKKSRNFIRVPFVLSMLGLLLSLFCGVGIAVSIPSLIISLLRYSKKQSKTLRWSITLSIVSIALSLLFIVTLIYALISGALIDSMQQFVCFCFG